MWFMQKTKECVRCDSKELDYFSSQAEAKRYNELALLQRCGEISQLEMQPVFEIKIDDIHITNYRADFSYIEDDEEVIEDVKGAQTEVFRLKKRMVEAAYGVKIRVIKA